METWVLVIMMNVHSSNAITHVPGFTSLQSCIIAGEKIKPTLEKTWTKIYPVCVRTN